MSISIVIPTIGSPPIEIIKESLNSALKSSPKLWSQIIIVDNSRNKEFETFLKQYTQNDSRVEVHHVSEPMTMAGCWNYGLNKVKNEWLLYLHDDDILTPESFNKSLLKNQAGIITFDYEVFGDERRLDKRLDTGLCSILLNTPKFVSTLINTSALKSIGCWKDEFGYFLDLVAFSQLESNYGHEHQNIIGGKYRIHTQNASNLRNRQSGYGNNIPETLKALFALSDERRVRKIMLFQVISFSYPEESLWARIIKKVLLLLGLKTWFS